jgi:hypothetical protein
MAGCHRRIDRIDVRDIETEAGPRQFLEHRRQLVCGGSGGLAVIDVLNDEPGVEPAMRSELVERVRMGDDRSHPQRQVSERLGTCRVVELAIFDGGMDAYVSEWEPPSGSEIRDQARRSSSDRAEGSIAEVEVSVASATNRSQSPRDSKTARDHSPSRARSAKTGSHSYEGAPVRVRPSALSQGAPPSGRSAGIATPNKAPPF